MPLLLVFALCLFIAVIGWKGERLKRGHVLSRRGIFNRIAYKARLKAIEKGAWNGPKLPSDGPVEESAFQRGYSLRALQLVARQKRKLEADKGRQPASPVPEALRKHRAEELARQVDARTRTARRAQIAKMGPDPDAYRAAPAKLNAEGKEWLPREEWIAGIDDPTIPDYGTWAKFEYYDADGVITKRHIRQWSKRGAYIEGFCMERREGRTFRQDRISDWVDG